jgi:hypothetical protein
MFLKKCKAVFLFTFYLVLGTLYFILFLQSNPLQSKLLNLTLKSDFAMGAVAEGHVTRSATPAK